MNEVMDQILALWEIDREIHRLDGLIRDLNAEEKRLLSRIEDEERAWEERKRQHQALRQRANAKALEVDETDERIRAYQRKLDHEIIPYKEMEYLKEQVELLRARLEDLEEEALALMDEVEEDAARLARDEEAFGSRKGKLEDELSALRDRRQGLEKKKEELLSRRQEALGALPQHLREHYERLHESVPDPVATVEGDTCGGCHLKLSENLLVQLREGKGVVICENCSRFLVSGWR